MAAESIDEIFDEWYSRVSTKSKFGVDVTNEHGLDKMTDPTNILIDPDEPENSKDSNNVDLNYNDVSAISQLQVVRFSQQTSNN